MLRSLMLTMCLMTSSTVVAQDYIVVVVDTSGSMDNRMSQVRDKTRMQVAKDALSSVLSNISSNTQIGILSFRGWEYEFGPVDSAKVQHAVAQTRPSGGTPLWAYMKAAADKLLEIREINNNVGRYKIVVVTDGEAGDESLISDTNWRGNVTEIPGYLTDIKSRGIIIDAIGLDMQRDHSLSTKINGTYMRGDDPKSLHESVSKAVAEVEFDDSGNDDEILKMIAEIPDDFAQAVVTGLSIFHNQPIGEAPVIVSVNLNTGEIISESSETDSSVEEAVALDESSPVFMWFGIFAAVFVVFIFLFSVMKGGR